MSADICQNVETVQGNSLRNKKNLVAGQPRLRGSDRRGNSISIASTTWRYVCDRNWRMSRLNCAGLKEAADCTIPFLCPSCSFH